MNAPTITDQDILTVASGATEIKGFRSSGQKQVFLCKIGGVKEVIKFIYIGQSNSGANSIDDVALERVQREVELINSIKSPYLPKPGNIKPNFHKKGEDVFFYYSEQFIDGQDLRDLLANANLSEAEIVKLLTHITSATELLFQAGIIHRDIKPENIMLDTKTGNFILIDAGAALAKNETTLTPDGFVIGTLIYMSPEQIKGKRNELDVRSDQYSLGVVAYEAVTGTHPYCKSGMSRSEIYKQICVEAPPKLSSLKTKVSPKISSVIDRMISKVPHMRFRSCQKLIEALTS